MYTIYGKTNCAQCEAAKRFLNVNGISFEYKEFGKDYTIDELMQLPNVKREMPQVYEQDDAGVLTHIGSTVELMERVKKERT